MPLGNYFKRNASAWVSLVVLFGCVLITLALIFVAAQARALGDRFSVDGFEEIDQK